MPFTPAPRWTSELKWELAHHAHATVGRHRHDEHPTGFRLNNAFVAANIECYLAQNHIHSANATETRTPSYTLLNLSAGTDLTVSGRKIAELYVVANNLLDRAYQSHLSRLKYLDTDPVTGRQGVYNMGRNVTFKLVVPLEL